MMNTIQNPSFKPIDPDLGLGVGATSVSKGASAGGTSAFFEALQNSMEEVNQNQMAADGAIKDLIAGRTKNIHETMLQLQKADLSLKTMMQVRNKILEAYKEIMKMQV